MKAPRAPTRGHYDRGTSPSARAHLQQELILEAMSELMLERRSSRALPTISELCARTGLGRNTVYGHFANLEQAQDAVITSSTQCLLVALPKPEDFATLTPLGAVSFFVEGWTAAVLAAPEASRVALLVAPELIEPQVEVALAALLARGVSAGTFAPGSPLRAALLAAAVLAAGKVLLDDREPRDHLTDTLRNLLVAGARS